MFQTYTTVAYCHIFSKSKGNKLNKILSLKYLNKNPTYIYIFKKDYVKGLL